MPNIFGPVPSRRLGLSLGVDLIPKKTCSYDCLYCQVGRTTNRTTEVKPYIPIQKILDELKQRLEDTRPDTITLAGSGEPTLNAEIDQVISAIQKMTSIKVAVLTNGSLFWNEPVRKRVSKADIIMPTLTTVNEDTYRVIHRPYSSLHVSDIIKGLKALRQSFRGYYFLELILLGGMNDNDKEIEGLKSAMDEIRPDKIQLNTVVRPPSVAQAKALDRRQLERIKIFFGDKAEIIVPSSIKQKDGQYNSQSNALLEIAKRRPVRAIDIANVLNKPLNDLEERGFLSTHADDRACIRLNK